VQFDINVDKMQLKYGRNGARCVAVASKKAPREQWVRRRGNQRARGLVQESRRAHGLNGAGELFRHSSEERGTIAADVPVYLGQGGRQADIGSN
jgi:hypothetical protein